MFTGSETDPKSQISKNILNLQDCLRVWRQGRLKPEAVHSRRPYCLQFLTLAAKCSCTLLAILPWFSRPFLLPRPLILPFSTPGLGTASCGGGLAAEPPLVRAGVTQFCLRQYNCHDLHPSQNLHKRLGAQLHNFLQFEENQEMWNSCVCYFTREVGRVFG